jgi:hypothetical protein
MFGVGHNRTVDIPLFPGIFPNYVAPVVRHPPMATASSST